MHERQCWQMFGILATNTIKITTMYFGHHKTEYCELNGRITEKGAYNTVIYCRKASVKTERFSSLSIRERLYNNAI